MIWPGNQPVPLTIRLYAYQASEGLVHVEGVPVRMGAANNFGREFSPTHPHGGCCLLGAKYYGNGP